MRRRGGYSTGMNRALVAVIAVVIGVGFGLGMGGCAMTRAQKLERQADRVEASLKKERDRVLMLPDDDGSRVPRMEHLSGLRTTLSAANVARGLVPHLVEAREQDVAYDILEEVYSTIDWNIPLDPRTQASRPLPAGFSGGVLNLDEPKRMGTP